jgi:hypothetical protein
MFWCGSWSPVAFAIKDNAVGAMAEAIDDSGSGHIQRTNDWLATVWVQGNYYVLSNCVSNLAFN